MWYYCSQLSRKSNWVQYTVNWNRNWTHLKWYLQLKIIFLPRLRYCLKCCQNSTFSLSALFHIKVIPITDIKRKMQIFICFFSFQAEINSQNILFPKLDLFVVPMYTDTAKEYIMIPCMFLYGRHIWGHCVSLQPRGRIAHNMAPCKSSPVANS